MLWSVATDVFLSFIGIFDIHFCTPNTCHCWSIMFSIFVFPVTVPCPPYNILAQMDILTGTAILSWSLSAGALRYKAIAVSGFSGTSVFCNTNQTNCNLNNLLCGDKYNVTVQAMGSICNSSASMARYLQTGDIYSFLIALLYFFLYKWEEFILFVSFFTVIFTRQICNFNKFILWYQGHAFLCWWVWHTRHLSLCSCGTWPEVLITTLLRLYRSRAYSHPAWPVTPHVCSTDWTAVRSTTSLWPPTAISTRMGSHPTHLHSPQVRESQPTHVIQSILSGVENMRTYKKIIGTNLQFDSSPKHCAKATQEWLKRVIFVNWPNLCPELNVIENLWQCFKFAVKEKQKKLVKICQQKWAKIANSVQSWSALTLKDLNLLHHWKVVVVSKQHFFSFFFKDVLAYKSILVFSGKSL